MFIPRLGKSAKIGSKIILNHNVETMAGMFTKGHEMTITEEYTNLNRTCFVAKDEDGNQITDLMYTNFTVVTP